MSIPSNFDLYKLALMPGRLEQWTKKSDMGFIGHSQNLMRTRNGIYLTMIFAIAFTALLYFGRRSKKEIKKFTFGFLVFSLSIQLYKLVQVVNAVRNQYLFENFELENISKALKL